MQMKSENVKNVRISTRFGRVELFEREAGVSKTSCSYGDEIMKRKLSVTRKLQEVFLM
jgi:hypothetical protein